MEEEKQYNPFLRTGQQSLLESLGLDTTEPEENIEMIRLKALADIRNRKDKFKYKL